MTLSDGSTTLVCEMCGLTSRYETFVWCQGEVVLCQNATTCKERQNLRDGVVLKTTPKRKWWQFA